MSIQDIQEATQNEAHLQKLREDITKGLLSKGNELKQGIRLYWMFKR